MKCSDERKEAELKKLLPAYNCTVAQLAEEDGILAATLYNWCKQASSQGRLLPHHRVEPAGWSSQDKGSSPVLWSRRASWSATPAPASRS